MELNAIVLTEENVLDTLERDFIIDFYDPFTGFPVLSLGETFFTEEESIDTFIDAMGLLYRIFPNDGDIVENLHLYHDVIQEKFVLTWEQD